MVLETNDNQLPWIQYFTGEYTWYGKAIYKKEYLKIVKYHKGIKYITAKQYSTLGWRAAFKANVKPYGWWC